MMNFNTKYNEIKSEYYGVSKKILNYEKKRDLNDDEKIKQYRDEILNVYNKFVGFVRENLPNQSREIQNKVSEKFEKFYKRNFLRCLHTLDLDTILPNKFGDVHLDALVAHEGGASG